MKIQITMLNIMLNKLKTLLNDLIELFFFFYIYKNKRHKNSKKKKKLSKQL